VLVDIVGVVVKPKKSRERIQLCVTSKAFTAIVVWEHEKDVVIIIVKQLNRKDNKSIFVMY